MSLNIPQTLPARSILEEEGLFPCAHQHALHKTTHPLEIAILNLMPTKIVTETQLLRQLAVSALPINITLLYTVSHESKNTPIEHLRAHYTGFADIQKRHYDGLIITGAPVEQLDFEAVDYWDELVQILEWKETHVRSTFHICWAAQAGLYHKYGIPKYPLEEKMFGVFAHQVLNPAAPLVRGFDDEFFAPHSRHTEVRAADIARAPALELLARSPEAGAYLVVSKDGRDIYVTGHSEYDPLTLKAEYERDVQRGLPIRMPRNYFPGDDASQAPVVRWRAHAALLYGNWLAYHVA